MSIHELMNKLNDDFRNTQSWPIHKRYEFVEKMEDIFGDVREVELWASNLKEDYLWIEAYEDTMKKIYKVLNDMISETEHTKGQEYSKLYKESVEGYVSFEELAQKLLLDVLDGKDISADIKDGIDQLLSDYEQEISRDVEQELERRKQERELSDTVRFMQTPEEAARIEVPTNPHELENVPEEAGFGSVSSKQHNYKIGSSREKLEQSLEKIKEQLKGDTNAMRKGELYKRLREIEKDLEKIDKEVRGSNMLAKLYKLAYRLDKLALYDEAKEIEAVMKTLSERVGLSTEDMVSLADHFDQAGDTALADRFDEMVKEAKKKSK